MKPTISYWPALVRAAITTTAFLFATSPLAFAQGQTGNAQPARFKVANRVAPKPGGGGARPPAASADKSIGETYNSREQKTCEDTTAPARGPITAVLAQKYLGCQQEGVSSGKLYLLENIKVQVGGGISYASIMGQRSFSEIDVNHPVYPIRGSFVHYQCSDPVREHVGPPDTNCATYNNPKATGYCYKTTFGDWRCTMGDPASSEAQNIRRNVAPPKP